MRLLGRNIKMLAISLLGAISVASCNVHEWPEVEPVVPIPFRLKLDVDRTIKEYDSSLMNTTNAGFATTYSDETHDMRYIVNIYRYPGSGDLDRTIIAHHQFAKDEVMEADYEAVIQLVPGRYRVMVWCDHVLQGSTEQLFYSAEDFASILLRQGPHSGCNEVRDAYSGVYDFEIVDPAKVDQATLAAAATDDIVEDDTEQILPETTINDITVTLTRPMAKYRFISTGLKKFIERMQTRAYERLIAEGKSVSDVSRIPIDINEYTVKMYYAGFMPEEFNMYKDWVAWSRLGANYSSKLTQISEDEVLLAFDYVFVSDKIDIEISFELFDKEGESVASYSKYKTPLQRNRLTTVRDVFLLSKAQGSIGISPGFDDEIVVPID